MDGGLFSEKARRFARTLLPLFLCRMYSGLGRTTFPPFPFAILLLSVVRSMSCPRDDKNKEMEKEKEKER